MQGRVSVMNVVIADGKVTYTCPGCNHRQTHFWYGREKHICIKCEKQTDIKGETWSTPSRIKAA